MSSELGFEPRRPHFLLKKRLIAPELSYEVVNSEEALTLKSNRFYFLPEILNTFVPHLGHLPVTAFRLFFIVTGFTSVLTFFLHFTQYISSVAMLLHLTRTMPVNLLPDIYGIPDLKFIESAIPNP
jgi:hypothetical protein